MSCFGCFSKPIDLQGSNEKHGTEGNKFPVVQRVEDISDDRRGTVQKSPPVSLTKPVVASASNAQTIPVESVLPAPWRSREELADIALRIADAQGLWLERAQQIANNLSSSLGATLVIIWAFSSDKSTAVVLASGGVLRTTRPQGHSLVLECSKSQSEPSLRRVLATEAPFTWSACTCNSSGAGSEYHGDGKPSDLNELATTAGIQHFAVLPLKYGGALAGALQISVGGSQSPALAHAVSPLYAADVASGRKSFGESTLNETGSAAAAGNIHVSVMPNWLPHHLPNLVLLSPATAAAMSGIGFGLGMHMAGGPPVLPLPQIVVDLVASLRRCDTINKLIEAVIVGLQDLTHRATSMHFCATPMLLHRSAVSAAIFHDFGPREGNNTRGDLERDIRLKSIAPSNSTGNSHDLSPRSIKAQVMHLNHTLMLQLLTGIDNTRYRQQYGGSIIQNCSEYMQEDSNRGRDVSLCHRVGVADVGSLVLATGMAPGAVPLIATYLTSREPLPETLLESALAVVHQAIKLSLLTIHSLLEPGGDLHDEWSTLHDFHLNPSSIAVSTSCTPRSIISRSTANNVASKENPGLGQQLQHQTSGITSQPLSSPFNEEDLGNGMPPGLPSITKPVNENRNEPGTAGAANSGAMARRNLSFFITTASAITAPRSNLGMMVSSIRSSLNQVLSQRAALEAEGLQDDVNGVELLKQVGQGGQGVVFCGTLHGLEVAIKVVGTEEGADEVYDIDDEGQMIKLKRVLKRDATELAVTTSISHPNIVQVFSYFMDVMVVEYVGQPDRFKLLPKANSQTATVAQNGSSVTGPSNMIICMEYCDAGSLKQAVKRGCFRVAGSRPNMQALYTTLMEIALALRHLHALRLVHCDLKPSNILLKSSMRDPRGWVCKLSDFGCVRLMAEPAPGQRPTFNLEYAVGTPSFMAPEMFCKSHPLDAMVDIYSFGILMWEVYVGGNVYEGVPQDKLPYHVVKRGLRPSFPADAASTYRSLAQACWASDPRTRPTAAALVTVLQRLLSSCSTAAAALSNGSTGTTAAVGG